MSSSIDPSARFEAEGLGDGSRVLPYARVGPEVEIASNCIVYDHAVLLGPVVLSDGVSVGVGARVLGPVRLDEGVTVGASAVVGGAVDGEEERETVVHRFATVGSNATVLAGADIGRRAVVEAGSVVRESVPANAVVTGDPARIVSYVDSAPRPDDGAAAVAAPPDAKRMSTRVDGVELLRLTHARDLRGSLIAAEFEQLPFPPRRLFTVFDVPSESVRGAHAHRTCSQFLIRMAGSVSCLVDDGSAREEIRLDRSDVGLLIPPMIWGTQWRYTRDAVLLVLASHAYDSGDYIRDYEEFLDELARARG